MGNADGSIVDPPTAATERQFDGRGLARKQKAFLVRSDSRRTLRRTHVAACCLAGPRCTARTGRAVAGAILLLCSSLPATAEEFRIEARFDWVTEGDIYQVWFHREFDGNLIQTEPVQVDSSARIEGLLADVAVACSAHAAIGLPDWSTTSGICVLRNAASTLTIEIDECAGTQSQCEGRWQIVESSGAMAGAAGSGVALVRLVDPSPLPWLYNGPVVGFSILNGVVDLP